MLGGRLSTGCNRQSLFNSGSATHSRGSFEAACLGALDPQVVGDVGHQRRRQGHPAVQVKVTLIVRGVAGSGVVVQP